MPAFDPRAIRAVTFDLYGTLLDLEATFAPAFSGFLQARGIEIDAADLVRTWEWAYLHEGMVDTFLGGTRTPFEQLRRTTLSQVFARMGIEHSRDDIDELLTARVTPTLFPDVVESLTAMRGQYTLSVLSNGDLAVLERIVSTLEIPVHRTISVEQAGCYKPDQRVYRRAAELLSVEAGEILHVAAHAWDIRAARTAGMHGAYVDRHSIPYAPFTDDLPDLETATLPELAAILG
jgi:2-haloacid dehalogenase